MPFQAKIETLEQRADKQSEVSREQAAAINDLRIELKNLAIAIARVESELASSKWWVMATIAAVGVFLKYAK